MSDKKNACPKCSGEFEKGFTLDEAYGRTGFSHWARGEPHKSFWKGGVKIPRKHDTFWTGKFDVLGIVTFRCTSCGFLEQYAPAD